MERLEMLVVRYNSGRTLRAQGFRTEFQRNIEHSQLRELICELDPGQDLGEGDARAGVRGLWPEDYPQVLQRPMETTAEAERQYRELGRKLGQLSTALETFHNQTDPEDWPPALVYECERLRIEGEKTYELMSAMEDAYHIPESQVQRILNGAG